jgi:hypothetical protein
MGKACAARAHEMNFVAFCHHQAAFDGHFPMLVTIFLLTQTQGHPDQHAQHSPKAKRIENGGAARI